MRRLTAANSAGNYLDIVLAISAKWLSLRPCKRDNTKLHSRFRRFAGQKRGMQTKKNKVDNVLCDRLTAPGSARTTQPTSVQVYNHDLPVLPLLFGQRSCGPQKELPYKVMETGVATSPHFPKVRFPDREGKVIFS